MLTTTITGRDELQSYLRRHGVSFTLRHHPRAFTARQVAASEHIPYAQLAKPVFVVTDARQVLVVLPASRMIELSKLARQLGAKYARLADETEIARVFDDCELGALPPFGNLYGLDVYADRTLTEDAHIEFRACTHTDTIRLSYADFERLVHPTVVDVAED
jgi:Ala-tRNA(Pro) deacylase